MSAQCRKLLPAALAVAFLTIAAPAMLQTVTAADPEQATDLQFNRDIRPIDCRHAVRDNG